MKYLNMILAVSLVGIVAAHAAQKVTFSDREVRDPKQLAPALEANATDAETRLAAIEGGTATVTLAPNKILVGNDASNQTAMAVQGDVTITQDGTNITTAIAAGVIVNADVATNAAIAGSKLAQAVQDSLALADDAVQPTDADYTNAVALAGSALQSVDWGDIGGALSGQLDLTNTVALAGSAVQTEADPVASPVINALIDYLADGLLVHGALAISAGEADQFKTTATAVYTIAGVTYTKAATDALEFTAADTINTAGGDIGTAYGIWLVQINAAGAISTKPGGGLSDQVYESSALAIAALPAVDSGNVSLGYILVATPTSTPFTANTTVLTTIGSFSNTQVKALPAAL
jgi:hypothetical protein